MNKNIKFIIIDKIIELSFIYNNKDLIYYKNKFIDFERLYIFQALIKNIFKIVYNNNYLDFKRFFDIIFKL